MTRKLSDETRELMEQLYADNLLIEEIAIRANVSYISAYSYYKLRQSTNPETGNPFESLSQLMAYQARQRKNPETGNPFESLSQLREYQARQRTNPETGNPFESLSQLMDYQARQRQKRRKNQALSNLIKRRLKELKKNQSWLAKKISVTRQAVSLYVKGRSVPIHEEDLGKLFSALEVPYQTLDDLLADI